MTQQRQEQYISVLTTPRHKELSGYVVASSQQQDSTRSQSNVKRLDETVVLVTPRSFGVGDPTVREQLEAAVGEVRYNSHHRPLRGDELRAQVEDVDGIIAGLDEINADVLACARRLRIVARYGVGTSNVDVRAAAHRGIIVTNTPGANAVAVAELAIGLIFALARGIPAADKATELGAWPSMRGIEVAGRCVGILGLGQIGRAVATRALALECRVLAHDPYVDAETALELGIRLTTRDEVVAGADFLSLHLPATAESYDLVNRDFLQRMRKGAYLVNTARGELVVEDDLLWALQSGHIQGAALDTLRQEPPPKDHPLIRRTDVLVTPHIGAHTVEAAGAMGRISVADLLSVLSGQAPRFPVVVPSGSNS